MYTGLISDPLSKSLVLNSRDGKLQFYKPDTDSLAFTVNETVFFTKLPKIPTVCLGLREAIEKRRRGEPKSGFM